MVFGPLGGAFYCLQCIETLRVAVFDTTANNGSMLIRREIFRRVFGLVKVLVRGIAKNIDD